MYCKHPYRIMTEPSLVEDLQLFRFMLDTKNIPQTSDWWVSLIHGPVRLKVAFCTMTAELVIACECFGASFTFMRFLAGMNYKVTSGRFLSLEVLLANWTG